MPLRHGRRAWSARSVGELLEDDEARGLQQRDHRWPVGLVHRLTVAVSRMNVAWPTSWPCTGARNAVERAHEASSR